MSRRLRMVIFAVGSGGLIVFLVPALLAIPDFGGTFHPYRDRAVATAVDQMTANAVSSVNFDQRALDTFGEETILLACVIGAATLLRATREEERNAPPDPIRVLPTTRLVGYLLLPVTVVLGLDVVIHGHLTPGGGFQGGVILATGLHLLYVAGSYPVLRRIRPLSWYEYGEAAGVGAVGVFGAAGLLLGSGLLANILPLGTMGDLASAGSVVLLNVAVGLAVASGVIVLLAQFLDADVTRSSR